MKRILVLVSTVALALLLVGGVAISKQPPPTIDKGSGSIPRSTLVKASFASGSGSNFLGVKVSDHGNLVSFESPVNQEAVFGGREGYAVCSNFTGTIHGHDTGDVESGFGPPTFAQPNGAGTFPLTVTRKSTDGKFQLTQVWNKPDAIEKDVTVTMTLKNLSSTTINNVFLSRSGDFDVGTSANDRGARTSDSAWQWDDVNGGDSPPVGLMLTALTLGTTHAGFVDFHSDWVDGTRESCFESTPALSTPTSAQDLAMRVRYSLFAFSAGQSKTLKFEYGRM
jgi:hypothetical protein